MSLLIVEWMTMLYGGKIRRNKVLRNSGGLPVANTNPSEYLASAAEVL